MRGGLFGQLSFNGSFFDRHQDGDISRHSDLDNILQAIQWPSSGYELNIALYIGLILSCFQKCDASPDNGS